MDNRCLYAARSSRSRHLLRSETQHPVLMMTDISATYNLSRIVCPGLVEGVGPRFVGLGSMGTSLGRD
jgi:hypothetical protein